MLAHNHRAVVTTSGELATRTLLRSYTSSNDLDNIPATIVEAVRATSAATSFFDPITIGPDERRFHDGGIGLNNPAEYVWSENQTILGERTDLSAMVKCFVSIGTGKPETSKIHDNAWKFFSDTLTKIVTDTEATAKNFEASHSLLFHAKRYFRFNVEQGLQGVGLEEYAEVPKITTATAEYMDWAHITKEAEACALNLAQKDCMLEDFA